MVQDAPQDANPAGRKRLSIGCLASLMLLAIVLIGFAIAWTNRESIVDNVIADALESRGIRATYEIASIGPDRQILHNIVVGDPARPDITVDWAMVSVQPRLGVPRIGSVRLVRPRLYGSYRGGALSFGALDPLIFTESDEPFRLPDIVLDIEDGRALVQSDHGDMGASLTGAGNLRSGFTGEMAVSAPALSAGACRAEGATLYGEVKIANLRPGLAGPLRLRGFDCGDGAPRGEDAAIALSLQVLRDLSGVEGDARLELASLAQGDNSIADLGGTGRFTWRGDALTARYDLAGADFTSAEASIATVRAEGSLRALRFFERIELVGSLNAGGVSPGQQNFAALRGVERAAEGWLAAPIVRRIAAALQREGQGSSLRADYTARRTGDMTSLVVPTAILRGGSGDSLLNLSRLQILLRDGEPAELSGNFVTGGADLPRIAGRMEQSGRALPSLRLTMAPYRAGNASLALPELVVTSGGDGSLRFAGEVRASGILPGGRVDGLVLPVSGQWSDRGGLALWPGCTEVRFDALQMAGLALDRKRLQLCPQRGAPVLRYGAGGLRLAAGAPALELQGRLGETPLAISSGPVGFAWPGHLSARDLAINLGPQGSTASFTIEDLNARIGADVAGRFAGTDVLLGAVPLDIRDAGGEWRYADGRLTLSEAAFRLEDRADAPRFEPLAARGALLTLEDNRIRSRALLREPRSDSAVVRVDLDHDLATARGHAELAVDALAFTRELQPAQLTDLALGVVANVRGTVTGHGRIDWTENDISSGGRFSSESLDLAAAFGLVRGAAGTIVFDDLLNMTTAPNQEVRIAAVNPGIEVFDGVVRYAITGGELLQLHSGIWPFLGGTLTMQPVDIRFGASEIRHYVFEVDGLEAARFVERMELNNLGAQGTFDGTIPVVFDAAGNGRLEGGMLISRPPGGNVSYIGELTYEDLSPMANYAFDMLRSLDYRSMSVQMDGPLTGEIVTRVRFDGVRQGEGTRQNFITRRIARLPVRFAVNVRAPFYSLLGSVRALYDPAAIRDPRELGLIDADGDVRRRESSGEEPIQPRASEDVQ